MELNDCFVINQSGEIFLKVTADDLNQDFLSQANKSLAEQFAHAERKCQTKKYNDVKFNVVAGIFMMAFMACVCIVGMFLSIFWHLAFIALIVFGALCIVFWGVMFYRNKHKLRQLQSRINLAELLICKKINTEIVFTSLSADLQYQYIYNSQEITRTCKVINSAWQHYLPLPYVIIAYDKTSGQSYPVRLFLNKEIKT